MLGNRRVLIFVLLSVGAAGTLLWLSAVYFRRKRRQPATRANTRSSYSELRRRGNALEGLPRSSRSRPLSRASSRDADKGPDLIPKLGRTGSVLGHHPSDNRSAIITADSKASDDSAVDIQEPGDDERLVDEMIRKGVDEFESALEHWHIAADHLLEQQNSSPTADGEIQIYEKSEQEVTINSLIYSSRRLRMAIILRGLAPSEKFAVTPRNILAWMDEDLLEASLAELDERSQDGFDSDADSFVSASESAALEFDDLIDEKFISESAQLKMFRQTILKAAGQHSHLEFYVSGLEHYARCDVDCRKMRTAVVGCESDMEFLAKVVCVRQASEVAFSSTETFTWLSDTGRFMLSSIISSAGKNPTDFEAAFDELLEYCAVPENWQQIQDELLGRKVSTFSFYDVVLDYVLLDAFDDLETPPYSVATAIQNRWLSASIKETALTAAIWGVLKAKSSYLQDQYGFMTHFYVVSQYILPVLAWGFLGTNEELKELCEFFKEQTLGYIRDIFSFEAADYTSVTSLSTSIITLAKQRSEVLERRLQKLFPQVGTTESSASR